MGSSATENRLLLSKIATSDGHGENSPYFDGWKAYDGNPFHPTENPEGVIQMGLAENQLSFDLIQDWIRKNPKASICTAEGVEEFKNVAIFQDYHGFPEFRKAVAMFMSKARGGRVTFDPNRIVMSGGATGANELVMFCLANKGDAFLVPSPYYPAYELNPFYFLHFSTLVISLCFSCLRILFYLRIKATLKYLVDYVFLSCKHN